VISDLLDVDYGIRDSYQLIAIGIYNAVAVARLSLLTLSVVAPGTNIAETLVVVLAAVVAVCAVVDADVISTASQAVFGAVIVVLAALKEIH